MKVIFSYGLPFSLAHGGQQTLIEAVMRELTALGVDVEPERWWDPNQSGDILQFVGRSSNVGFARQKGYKTVMMENLDVAASESGLRVLLRRTATRMARKLLPSVNSRLSFYRDLDALIYVVPHEWEFVQKMYGVPAEKGTIIPHGLESDAMKALQAPQPEGDYLVSVGTICSRKNTVLLARCARDAKVPILFLGKSFSEDDAYYKEFLTLVDGRYVQYPGYVSEAKKYELLRGARGSVLLSSGESGCIAIYEAAAAGLPLLLSDLPWARNGYPASDRIKLVSLKSTSTIVSALESFYKTAHRSETMTFPIGTWNDVARRYLALYERLLDNRGAVA